MIQRAEVMEILIESCPSFQMRWEEHLQDIWDRESKTILYTDFSEFARYLSELVILRDFREFTDVFDTVELLLHEGDPFVREAVVVGLLEDFQNCLLSKGYDLSLIEKYLKSETKKHWLELIKYWNGEISSLSIN